MGRAGSPYRGSHSSTTVTGFCEWCGRNQVVERDGRLQPTPTGEYVCPRCYAALVGNAEDGRRTAGPPGRRMAGGVVAGIAVFGVAAAAVIALQLGNGTGSPDGGVLGITRAGSSASPIESPAAAARASGAPSRAVPPESSSPRPVRSTPPRPVELTVGPGTVATWKGGLGETRMQVLVPVRNETSGWVAVDRSSSTYRVRDATDQEIASGVFTAALPAAIEPNGTGYLVETVSVAFVTGHGPMTIEAHVAGSATDEPTAHLSVDDLRTATASDGGLRVTGRILNEGTAASGWVVAGVVVVDSAGKPISAVYDPGRIGTIPAGSSVPFDTTYPGAPPVNVSDTHLVGVAFEALRDAAG